MRRRLIAFSTRRGPGGSGGGARRGFAEGQSSTTWPALRQEMQGRSGQSRRTWPMALQPGRLPPRALKQRMNMFLCISIVFQNTYFGRKILEIFWVTNKGGEIKTGLGKQKIREKTSIQMVRWDGSTTILSSSSAAGSVASAGGRQTGD